MSKAEMKSFTCPACGWNVKTPWGENDIIDHAELHSKNHHPEMMNMKEEELASMIKDV